MLQLALDGLGRHGKAERAQSVGDVGPAWGSAIDPRCAVGPRRCYDNKKRDQRNELEERDESDG